ncbi:Oidioi.mRNA.OKI2018_I69.XSR.g13464.t1.cds [Oikopleura dioica]|uniref:Oidioi.mRNA.OKI2018_I69.XSR.g13464.t1.cds n=1 Tax=Oikopleura dioica TaxID=34765 RepID=A0ABN7S8N1_OIKDI|nr:Oidioi.mRNA.OKI2018_I69.XSR.g13464.t1.cds [Oikopleura dioica]
MLKVLVDCDPGVDDICALQFLINRNDVEIVGISIVHGNCPASVGAKNALKLLTLNNLQHKIPIFLAPIQRSSPKTKTGKSTIFTTEGMDYATSLRMM